MDISIYRGDNARAEFFFPSNSAGVSLAFGDSDRVTIYGLPHAKAKALVDLFADAETWLYRGDGLPSVNYLEAEGGAA
jgi:hypothetical protein